MRKAMLLLGVLALCWPAMSYAAPPEDKGPPEGKGPPTAEGEGNNLSVPVIFADGSLTLRGAFGSPVFGGAYVTDVAGTNWYLQQDPLNEWQAESLVAAAPIEIDVIDWGDNLEARPWYTKSVVRVETVLYQDVSAAPMLAFTMQHLYGDGPDEMWGADTTTFDSVEATLYSDCARLAIQRIDPNATVGSGLEWDALNGVWTGTGVFETVFSGDIEGGEGPGGYGAEINVSGKVIYGFNWQARPPRAAGLYRITFSLAADCNAFIGSGTDLKPFSEEEEEVSVSAEPVGGVAGLLPQYNLTYIDVQILERGGGGGRGRR